MIPDFTSSAETTTDLPPTVASVRTRRQKDSRVAYTLALRWTFGQAEEGREAVPELPASLLGPVVGWVEAAVKGTGRAVDLKIHSLAEGKASLWSLVVPTSGAAAETEQHVEAMDAVVERFTIRASKGSGAVVVHLRLIGTSMLAPGIVSLDRGACVVAFEKTTSTDQTDLVDEAAKAKAGDTRRAKARAAKKARAERAQAERQRQATGQTELVP